MLHDLALQNLEVILRNVRSALNLLIVHLVIVELGVHLLLVGLCGGAIALSHLQLTHLVELRSLARLGNLERLS